MGRIFLTLFIVVVAAAISMGLVPPGNHPAWPIMAAILWFVAGITVRVIWTERQI